MPQSATAPRAVAASRNVWTVVIVVFSAARPARIASRESHRREGSIIAEDVSGERALRTFYGGAKRLAATGNIFRLLAFLSHADGRQPAVVFAGDEESHL